MKVSTKYRIEAGRVRLSGRESVAWHEFRASQPADATITQPAWGWVEVTVEVAEDGKGLSQRPPRLEFK